MIYGKIILKGSPMTTNGLYATACRGRFPTRFMVGKAKALKEDYAWQARSQWKGGPIEDQLSVSILIFFGTKRKADWDNFHKLSMDALTGIVWEDDSQIMRAEVEKLYDKSDPRLEILVESYPQ